MTRVLASIRFTRSFPILVLLLASLFAAAPSRADTLYGVAQPGGGPTSPSTLYRINEITGTATPIGPIGFNGVGGIDFQPVTGKLYGVGKNGAGTNVLIIIDIKTGQGTEVGTLTGISTGGSGGLFDVSFRNSDRVLFLAALDDPDVAVYTVDVETGVTTSVGITGFLGSGNGFGFTLADDLFLMSGPNLASINQGTGVGTGVTTFSFAGFPVLTGPSLTAMDARPADGAIWVSVNDGSMGSGPNYIATVDTVTGSVRNEALSVNGLTGLAWRPERPVVPNGLLFGAARAAGETSASTLYSIDPATGSTAEIGPIGFNGIGGMDFHPVTKQLLGVAKRTSGNVDVLIEINPATGAGTEIGPLLNIAPVAGGLDLTFRPDGALFLAARMPGDNVGLYSVNQSTGEATLVGDTLANGIGNGLGYAPDDTLHFYSGLTLYEVDDATAATSSPAAADYIGFPTLANARITAIDFSSTYELPFVAIDDGTASSGPNYLAYFDTTTSAVFNIGRSIDGLIALAWRPARETCGTLLLGVGRTGSGISPSVFYEIDPSTGLALPISKIGFNEVRGLAMEPGTRELFAVGRRFFDDEPVLITIDTASGIGEEVGPLNATSLSSNHFDLGFRRGDGTLFMLAEDSLGANTLYTIDLTTGAATSVGATTTSAAGNGLAFDLGDTLFHTDDASGGTLRTVDTGTGVSSAGSAMAYSGFPTLNGPEPNALAVDHGTGAVYVSIDDGTGASGPNYLATLDPMTSTATHVGATVNGLDALEVYAGCEDLDLCTIDTCETCQQLLYGASHRGGAFGASTLRVIDPASGVAVPVGPIGFNDVNAMDFHPATGVLYGVGRRTTDGVSVLIAINPLSATSSEIGRLLDTNGAFAENHFDLSFRGATNVLYLEARDTNGDVSLFTIDLATGAATPVGVTGTTGSDHGFAISGADVLYQGDDTSGGTLSTVNAATGSATFSSTLTYVGFPTLIAPRPNAIDFELCDPASAVISIDDGASGQGPNYLATLDVTTGTVTYAGTSVNGLDALAWRDVAENYCTRFAPGDPDSDTVCDPVDNCPLIVNTDQADFDMDGLGNPCDIDDDNDTVPDGADSDQFNRFVCRDVEPDTCDDCSSGVDDPSNDGPDADAEGICDAGDNCDQDPNVDQANYDGDALGDVCDPDDDNDGVDDGTDSSQFDEFICRDADADTCDDCTSGTDDVSNDGLDTDGEGLCDLGDNCPGVANLTQENFDGDLQGDACDPDDDNDGVDDVDDWEPFLATSCRDADGDSCDDCVSGSDDPSNDGLDTDGEGICDAGDNCVNHPNPGQESQLFFPEQIMAVSQDVFEWSTPTDIVFLIGDFALLSNYVPGTVEQRAARTNFAVGDPSSGSRYYLVRVDCPVGSWASGGANECPDTTGCPNGGRDANLP